MKKGYLKEWLKTGGIDKTINIIPSGGLSNGKTSPMMLLDKQIVETLMKPQKCIIDEYLKKLEENGIPTPSITRHECIGGTWFPVTYHDNGMVFVDYLDTFLIKTKKNDNSTSSID